METDRFTANGYLGDGVALQHFDRNEQAKDGSSDDVHGVLVGGSPRMSARIWARAPGGFGLWDMPYTDLSGYRHGTMRR